MRRLRHAERRGQQHPQRRRSALRGSSRAASTSISDLAKGMLYWTDRGDETVNRAPMELPSGATAATRNDREILVTQVGEAIGLALDPERGTMYYTAADGVVYSANLDGSNPSEVVRGTWILTGITLGPGP